jgi:hypothetical protein
MPVLQPIYKSGTRHAALGRRLNASRSVAQHVLDATVELYSADDVIAAKGEYGLYFVRSSCSFSRYYPVRLSSDGEAGCTCQDHTHRHRDCKHITAAQEYQAAQSARQAARSESALLPNNQSFSI